MRLFIAEKPSVAKAIAEELGVVRRDASSITCQGDNIVTWCFGHLLEQAEPDDYLPDDIPRTKKGKKLWRIKDLPIFPSEWIVSPRNDAGVKRQLAAIGRYIAGAETIVNAGDPDREGQLLVDEVIEHFDAKQPVERFWVSAVDPASIKKGLKALRKNADYAGMRDAARGRSRADWLLGMNLSRAYTLFNQPEFGKGDLIAVGRVQTPTLTMVARRDYAVRNFKPQPFLNIVAALAADEKPFTAKWKPSENQKGMDEEGKLLINMAVGKELIERLSKETAATVTSAETKRKKALQPKAYSLADIQIEASRLFGYTAEETLNICQSLYEEHKVTSYPRTDCSFLPESQHADAPGVLAAVAATFPATAVAVAKADPKIKSPTFNDKKITAHHGIVPVANTIAWGRLNEKEKNLYRLIAKRYIAQFYPVHEYDATEIVLDIGGETFTAKGNVVVKKGWKILYATPTKPATTAATTSAPIQADESSKAKGHKKSTRDAEEDQQLPALKKGDVCTVISVAGKESQTKPPAYFTEGTLIAAMENIWRSFEDEKLQAQLKEAGGIGTPATRAAIISELRRKTYLEADGKVLHCTEMGRSLLKKVSPQIRSAVLTAKFEEKLKLVEKGECRIDDFVAEYETFIRGEISKITDVMSLW